MLVGPDRKNVLTLALSHDHLDLCKIPVVFEQMQHKSIFQDIKLNKRGN